ncbi:MAG: hypothetical protein KDK66_05645, partial [Deltaproteobacteria bacterium]|nr:hypothetical protein [Deltaproteobacteria bacterium]
QALKDSIQRKDWDSPIVKEKRDEAQDLLSKLVSRLLLADNSIQNKFMPGILKLEDASVSRVFFERLNRSSERTKSDLFPLNSYYSPVKFNWKAGQVFFALEKADEALNNGEDYLQKYLEQFDQDFLLAKITGKKLTDAELAMKLLKVRFEKTKTPIDLKPKAQRQLIQGLRQGLCSRNPERILFSLEAMLEFKAMGLDIQPLEKVLGHAKERLIKNLDPQKDPEQQERILNGLVNLRLLGLPSSLEKDGLRNIKEQIIQRAEKTNPRANRTNMKNNGYLLIGLRKLAIATTDSQEIVDYLTKELRAGYQEDSHCHYNGQELASALWNIASFEKTSAKQEKNIMEFLKDIKENPQTQKIIQEYLSIIFTHYQATKN